MADRFDLGLPSNLLPTPRKDYVDLQHRWGAGQKDDGSDGFQIYQNRGFRLLRLFLPGRSVRPRLREEADGMLLSMLGALQRGKFQGFSPNGMTSDWKA
jgi:hypothetical protein